MALNQGNESVELQWQPHQVSVWGTGDIYPRYLVILSVDVCASPKRCLGNLPGACVRAVSRIGESCVIFK